MKRVLAAGLSLAFLAGCESDTLHETEVVTVTVAPTERDYGAEGDIQVVHHAYGLRGEVERCYRTDTGVNMEYSIKSDLLAQVEIGGTAIVTNKDRERLASAEIWEADVKPGTIRGQVSIEGEFEDGFICGFATLESFAPGQTVPPLKD